MSHIVKCKYCNLSFDRDKEPYVQVSGRRYAHPPCYENYLKTQTEEEKDMIIFYDYVKNLFKKDYNYLVTKKLAEKYIKENNYTYSGMTKALKWYYEIEKNPLDKAKGTIGILPYCYAQARDYYYSLMVANYINQQKNLKEYIPKKVYLTIETPETYIKPKKLFNFDNEEEMMIE